MSYRIYLVSIPRNRYIKIKDLNKRQFIRKFKLQKDECGKYNVDIHKIFNQELFNFGSSVSYDCQETAESLFSQKDTRDLVDDEYYNLRVLTKEDFANLIEQERKIVAEHYHKMLEPFIVTYPDEREWYDLRLDFTKGKQYEFDSFRNWLSSKYREWNPLLKHSKPYNLDDEHKQCVSSWKREYAIFELVRIYKSFNWKHNVMVIYGW